MKFSDALIICLIFYIFVYVKHLVTIYTSAFQFFYLHNLYCRVLFCIKFNQSQKYFVIFCLNLQRMSVAYIVCKLRALQLAHRCKKKDL